MQSYMIGMPWKLKTYWQSRLKTLVQNWAGVSLELTDIYGMRRYEDGARYVMRIDMLVFRGTLLYTVDAVFN